MADVPVLACTAGELAGKRIPVPEGGLGIGRSAENGLLNLPDVMSRKKQVAPKLMAATAR